VTELTMKPKSSPTAAGERPSLHSDSLAEIDSIADTLVAEITKSATAELRARLEHVSVHLNPRAGQQEVVVRTLPYPPFFEVTTREI